MMSCLLLSNDRDHDMLCSEKLDAQLVLLSKDLGLVALDEHLEGLLE